MNKIQISKLLCCVLYLWWILPVANAQDTALEQQSVAPEGAIEGATEDATEKPKKLVDSATINLRTTVTGSQEQPRVLYIMPWQSPAAEELEIEMLSSQQDAVFGHVEREEMLRGLESAGEFDDTKK